MLYVHQYARLSVLICRYGQDLIAYMKRTAPAKYHQQLTPNYRMHFASSFSVQDLIQTAVSSCILSSTYPRCRLLLVPTQAQRRAQQYRRS